MNDVNNHGTPFSISRSSTPMIETPKSTTTVNVDKKFKEATKLLSEELQRVQKMPDYSERLKRYSLLKKHLKLGLGFSGLMNQPCEMPDYQLQSPHEKIIETVNLNNQHTVNNFVTQKEIDEEIARIEAENRGYKTNEELMKMLNPAADKYLSKIIWGEKKVLPKKKIQDLVNRLSKPQEKRLEEIKKGLALKELEYISNCTFQPNMKKKRQKNKSNVVERLFDYDVKHRKELQKKFEQEKKLKMEKELSECSFKPSITQQGESLQRSYDSLVAWKERQEQIRKEKIKKKENSGEVFTFQPQLGNSERRNKVIYILFINFISYINGN